MHLNSFPVRLILFLLFVCLLSACQTKKKAHEPSVPLSAQPNIVLIMCDDMGFSDLGCYGGEIQTPHIDALAEQGIRFSQFKNTGRCCPSRAALLTGRNQFAADMGWMTAVDEHRDSYRGQLSESIPTLAEILREHNYSTYMSGKWHLTLDPSYKTKSPEPNGSWPFQRGFNQSYAGLPGGGSYYNVEGLVRNETIIDSFPDDYYYTNAITENAVKFIEGHNPANPLFLYVAHYAPHRPLEAPQNRIEACRKRYEVGYDVLREQRYARLIEKGLILPDHELPVYEREFNNNRPSWNSLSDQKKELWITEMATYAAMIEIMDDGIGAVVKATRDKGIYDNTIFLFLSDNGATKEGGEISQLAADLSNTPFREYKISTYMGGTSSPLIVHYPKHFASINGAIRTGLTHITDIVPTCLEFAGVEYPPAFKEQPLAAVEGVSLLPTLKGKDTKTRDLFFQHEQSCAIISGQWKLVRKMLSQPWELINLDNDPFEQHDLSSKYPDIASKLENKWNLWAVQNNVFPIEKRGWAERIQHYMRLNPDQDGIDK